MKATKIFMVSVFALLLMNYSNTLIAQQYDWEPCLPDCETDVWNPPTNLPADEVTITVCNGQEEIKVKYRCRVACDTWYDIYIEGAGGKGNIGHVINSCYNGDYDLLLRDITEALLILNPCNFPPQPPQIDCETHWRVMKGSCWFGAWVTGVGGPEGGPQGYHPSDPYGWGWDFIAPCPAPQCCLEAFTVCYDGNNYNVTQTNYLPPEDPECEDTDLPATCHPVCGSVYNR